jgi:hypothetical protein
MKKMKEFSARNLKEKLWYEVCESAVTTWRELSSEQKSTKGVLILLLMLLGIMLMIGQVAEN